MLSTRRGALQAAGRFDKMRLAAHGCEARNLAAISQGSDRAQDAGSAFSAARCLPGRGPVLRRLYD